MNKGHYLVKEILRTVELQATSHSEADSQENTTIKSSHTSPLLNPQRQKRLVLAKKEKNIYNRIFKLYPCLATSHIYRLFGFMAINERSLVDPSFEQSYFSTYFNGRIINKIQFFRHSIVVEMSAALIPAVQPPVDYFINKNKSKGGQILFQLANQVAEVYQLFKTMPKAENSEDKPESVTKCLDALGDAMYVCTLGINKVAISNSLLSYLQYDLQQFGLQAIKSKTIFHEFFSASNYANSVVHLVRNLKYTVELFQNKISLSQFYKKTTQKFSDFIYSKSGVRSFCEMSFCMLNPTFFCHKIDFIYYKEGAATNGEIVASQLRLAIEEQQQRVRQGQYAMINKVKTIPSHLLRENQSLIATYRDISPTQTKKEQEHE